MDITYYIFYHNEEKVKDIRNEINDSRFVFVNLNQLKIPDHLIIEDMPAHLNRALFSEYLGLMSITPQTDLTACFTYSIPKKFSAEWADYTGCHNLFLPEIKFQSLTGAKFDIDCLYAPEFSDPSRDFPDVIRDIHTNFAINENNIPKKGPYKGSFVVDTRVFYDFQKWFETVARHVMRSYPYSNWGKNNSIFSLSAIGNKSDEEIKIDKFRHGIGDILERAVAYYFGQRYDANKMIKLGDHLYYSRRSDILFELLSRQKRDNRVIVVFSSSMYLDIIRNWLLAVNRLGIHNYLVVSLDKKAYSFMKINNIPSLLMEYNSDNFDIWTKRLALFGEINDLGVNFFHSDADAVWLRDPLERYFADNETDLIISQGTVWPHDIHAKWGFVLCCGLFYVKSSPKMGDFFKAMLDELAGNKDDQASLNRIIDRDDIVWQIDEPYDNFYNGKKFLCSRRSIIGVGKTLRIKVLPHHLFQRVYTKNQDPYVVHPLAAKHSSDTKQALKNAGCYLLEDERTLWRAVSGRIKSMFSKTA